MYEVMQDCMHERMQLFNLLGGLAFGLDLLGGQAVDEGARECYAISQPRGTGVDVQFGEGVGSFSGFMTLRGGRVEDCVDGLAGRVHEIERRGYGLDVEYRGPAGHENEIRRLGGVESGSVGVWCGIENEDLAAGVLGAAHFMLQPAGVGGDDHGKFGFSAVGPVDRRSLRVKVDHRSVAACGSEGNSKVQSDGGFSRAAFLTDKRDGLHGVAF